GKYPRHLKEVPARIMRDLLPPRAPVESRRPSRQARPSYAGGARSSTPGFAFRFDRRPAERVKRLLLGSLVHVLKREVVGKRRASKLEDGADSLDLGRGERSARLADPRLSSLR